MKKTMMNSEYRIDHKNNAITLGADFRETAESNIYSTEYRVLNLLKEKYTDFTFKNAPRRKDDKVKHGGVTIAWMEKYISLSDKRKEIVDEYVKIKATYKGHPAYYAKVKQWFLEQFPELTAKEKRRIQEEKEGKNKLDNVTSLDELKRTLIEKNTIKPAIEATRTPIPTTTTNPPTTTVKDDKKEKEQKPTG